MLVSAKTAPRNLLEPFHRGLERRRVDSRFCECLAERVDVAAIRDTPLKRSLDGSCSPAHERVIDDVSRFGEAIDEKFRQLRLEASTVADFMDAVALALLRSPEFACEVDNSVFIEGAESRIVAS